MGKDDNLYIRTIAWKKCKIIQIKAEKTRKVPKLNFKATEYYDFIGRIYTEIRNPLTDKIFLSEKNDDDIISAIASDES